MEIRRIGPDGSAADWLRNLENRVRSLETSPAGAIVIRQTLTTTDPVTGVSTIIGTLPDGSNGLAQFVNDVTPPEKPSTPVVTTSLGNVEVAWDGLDYLGDRPPVDYDKTVVESSASALGPWTFEQEMRGAGSVFVAGLTYSVERFFRLTSLDKNANASTPSTTVSVTPLPPVESPDISAALDALTTSVDGAQSTADSALTSANGKNKIYRGTTMPSGGTYIVGDTWFDSDDGNKIYTYDGTTFSPQQFGTSAIAALSITDALIGNLDAGKIITGTLDAARIGAHTITANQLVIADLSNLWENPDFESDTVGQQPKGIVANANCSVIDSSGFAGSAGNGSARMLAVNALNGSDNLVFGTELYPTQLDQEFYFKFEGRHLNTTGTGTTGIGFRTYGPTKTAIGNVSAATFGTTKATTVSSHTGTYKATSGVSYVQPYIYFNNNAETTNRFYIDNIIIRRKNGGELIVDGAINGQTIIGATIKTATTGARWEMDTAGLRGYGSSTQYFSADSTGLSITGSLTSEGGGYMGGSSTTLKTFMGKAGDYDASGIHFLDATDPLGTHESPAGLVAFGTTGRAVGIHSRNNGDGYDARVVVGPSADGYDGQVDIIANSSIGNAKVVITTPTLVVNGYTVTEKLACTFANGFANHASGQPLTTAMVAAGRVSMTGMIVLQSATVDVIVGYVATAHRPATKIYLPVVANYNGTNSFYAAIVTVETDGTIRLRPGGALAGGYVAITGFWNII